MMDRPLRAVRDGNVVGAEVVDQPRNFEDFFASEHARLYGALCLVTGNRHEAEEIMQDAFLRLWERWERVSTVEDLTGYLYRTAMNVFRNRYRRATIALRRTAHVAPSEDALRTVEDRDTVVRALRDLDPNQRAAVLLTGYVGLSSQEAGSMLGMRASTVRTVATRARAAIRETAGDIS